MDDGDGGANPRPPHVWGIWKKQRLEWGGDAHARTVLEQNRGLIGYFVRKTRLPTTAAFGADDLHAVFSAVLLQAWASYDPLKGAFSTWAHVWLSQAAMDIVRHVVGRSRAEQTAYVKALRERRAENDFLAGRTAEEPVRLTPRERRTLEAFTVRQVISIQATSSRETPLEDHLGVEDPIDERLAHEQVLAWLHKKLGNGVLTGRERIVMQGVLAEETFEVIGHRLGVSRQYAQVLYTQAIEKLRSAAERDRIPPP